MERDLFKIRKHRKTDAPLIEVMEAILEKTAQGKLGQKEMVVYFAQRLTDINNMRMLDLTFFSSFESSLGFRFNIESISNVNP